MPMQQRLQEDPRESMRKGDVTRRSVIRHLRSEIGNAEIDRQTTLDDEAVVHLLGREVGEIIRDPPYQAASMMDDTLAPPPSAVKTDKSTLSTLCQRVPVVATRSGHLEERRHLS